MVGWPTGSAAMTEPGDDGWTRRARPTFLYVMYAMILWAIPMGLIAAIDAARAAAMTAAIAAYLRAIPEPLYTLFGTGYLGYTVARQWGKAKGQP
ncbi:holin family protein [Hephaestia sp. CMS5P-6]|nr:holin family protein [Hephaestia mangrovi]